MPNIKSSIQRVKLSRTQNLRNKAGRSALRSTLKKFEVAMQSEDKDVIAETYQNAVKSLDRAATKGLIHKNNAANKKSSLTLRYQAAVQ